MPRSDEVLYEVLLCSCCQGLLLLCFFADVDRCFLFVGEIVARERYVWIAFKRQGSIILSLVFFCLIATEYRLFLQN